MAVAGKDYRKGQLFILAFDHRGTFTKNMLGITGRDPTFEEKKKISLFKRIIYDGFLRAIDSGIPLEIAGVLCDEEYGYNVLTDARAKGITFAIPVEKSGQDVFDFQHGERFPASIEEIDPTFVKVLVRFNPDGKEDDNRLSLGRLKQLSDYLESTKRGFLFELLVPPTLAQLASVNMDKAEFDLKLRPNLMVESMAMIQGLGIEPDIWKMEGVSDIGDARMIVAQAQDSGRKAGVITLGRGESKDKVKEWLTVGSKVDGILGFAVGRTIFWDTLTRYNAGSVSREQAAVEICDNYLDLVKFWRGA